jgi:hypothetical protein
VSGLSQQLLHLTEALRCEPLWHAEIQPFQRNAKPRLMKISAGNLSVCAVKGLKSAVRVIQAPVICRNRVRRHAIYPCVRHGFP